MASPRKNPETRIMTGYEMTRAQRTALNTSAVMNSMSNGDLVAALNRGEVVPLVAVDPNGSTETVQATMHMKEQDYTLLKAHARALRMSTFSYVRGLLFHGMDAHGKARLEVRVDYCGAMSVGQRQALKEALDAHPKYSSYGRLLMAVYAGEDITVPSPEPDTTPVSVKFLLDAKELKVLKRQAKAKKMTMPAYVRWLLFGDPVLPAKEAAWET